MIPSDCIKRKDALMALVYLTCYNSIEEIEERCKKHILGLGDGWINGIRDSIDVISLVPASDDAPARKGQWIPEPDRRYRWHCSECGYVIGVMKMDADFCLKCGADMREEET